MLFHEEIYRHDLCMGHNLNVVQLVVVNKMLNIELCLNVDLRMGIFLWNHFSGETIRTQLERKR